MVSWDWLSVLCLLLAILTILLHSLGIWWLMKTKCKIREHIEIFSLSISLIVWSCFQTIRITIEIEYPYSTKYFYGITASLVIPMYSAMILLTLQRFFAIWLHLRYESSWVFLKQTHMVVVSWIACVVFFIVILVGNITEIFSSKIWPAFSAGSGVLFTNFTFFGVYTYIYVKYRRSTQATKNTLYRNRKAKFFTPIIICSSFFFFGTLPHFFTALMPPDSRYPIIWLFLDGISNSFVYIFMKGNSLICCRKNNRVSKAASENTVTITVTATATATETS